MSDLAEFEMAAFRHVDDATRSSNDDISTVIQFLGLLLDVCATVHSLNGESRIALNPTDLLGDLHRELAGGAENDRLRYPSRLTLLDNWNSEGSGFAAACASLSDHVSTLASNWNRFDLNLSRSCPPLTCEG